MTTREYNYGKVSIGVIEYPSGTRTYHLHIGARYFPLFRRVMRWIVR